ncbi:MAG TPA: hypothetical protein DEQ72_01630 [Lachnospiraceae bacterium]|nr:hypothetical protein [Lachnospiraceae bacterium]
MYILLRFMPDCAIGFYFTISRLLSAIHPLIPAKKLFTPRKKAARRLRQLFSNPYAVFSNWELYSCA